MRWVRIECSVGDDPIVGALADALGVSIAEAVGLHALVWAKLPEHAKGGDLGLTPNGTLERWVSWTGKRGAFAEAYRRCCCDGEGIALDWERVNGAAMRESEATTERVRRLRAGKKGTATEAPTRPVPTPVLNGDDFRTVRRTGGERTPLNGTLTGTTSGVAATTDPASPERSPQNPVEKSVENVAEPVTPPRLERLKPPPVEPPAHPQQPAAVAEMNPQRPAATEQATAHVPAPPSSVLTRFVARFYAGAGKDRRADIIRQTNAFLNGAGVKWEGDLIRAVDAEHLDDCLLAVMEEPPREANAALVFVLYKLRDTYTETVSRRVKAMAGEQARVRQLPPPGMVGAEAPGATPIRAALAGVLDGLPDDPDDVSRGTGEPNGAQ